MSGGHTSSPRPAPAAESVIFSRYLIGVTASAELSDRYALACAALFPEPPSAPDAALVAFALRHPRWIAALDAAAALVRPGALLRRKILVMAAILETTPRHADLFLPRAQSPFGFFLTVMRVGVASAWRAAVGLLLLAVAQRAGR